MALGDEVLSADEGCGLRAPSRCRDTVKEHTRLACKPSKVEAIIARAGRKPTSFRRCTTNARAELNWSNLHAGPDFVEAGAYAPVRRDAHAAVVELPAGSIPASCHKILLTPKNGTLARRE